MNILITGAAGYIGSVVTEHLVREGHQVIALDNLQQGHREALVPEARFVNGDLGDSAVLDDIFSRYEIAMVIHLAADSIVAESIADPAKYFHNNVFGGLTLLNSMISHNVLKMIFSSTAAVYGAPSTIPITEDAVPAPDNPYGESKHMVERILKWYGEAYGLNSISIRFFNAAGATSLHGEHHVPETHLIPNVLNIAIGKDGYVPVFGADYETIDGTCIRDYVHVADIADAHLKALSRVEGARFRVYNLGSEQGYSVLEVVKAAEKVTGIRIPVQFHPRRTGDPTSLVASSKLIRKELGWTPRYTKLEDIIESAWRWLKRFPEGYSGRQISINSLERDP